MEISTLQGEHIVTIAISLAGTWHHLVLEVVAPLEGFKGPHCHIHHPWVDHQLAVVWEEVGMDLESRLLAGVEVVQENLIRAPLQGPVKDSQTSAQAET